jgi:hypothetical protein
LWSFSVASFLVEEVRTTAQLVLSELQAFYEPDEAASLGGEGIGHIRPVALHAQRAEEVGRRVHAHERISAAYLVGLAGEHLQLDRGRVHGLRHHCHRCRGDEHRKKLPTHLYPLSVLASKLDHTPLSYGNYR